MWRLNCLPYFYDNDDDGDDSREDDDSVCYVDHSYSISQRFFRTVRGFDLEVLEDIAELGPGFTGAYHVWFLCHGMIWHG